MADQSTADLLTRTGQLQQQIQRLHEIKKDIKVDVESAVARDEVLRSRDTKLNSHKLFLLNRPIRKGVIPYLWVLSVLFIGISLILFRMMLPESIPSTNSSAFGSSVSISLMISEFFENKMVIISIIVALCILSLFLGLRLAGVFG
jgi:hypothetical protein